MTSSRKWSDRLSKYFVDPRRSTHNYLLQFTLSLFVTGPCFMDSFFSASTTEIVEWMDVSHESFSLLISVPALTGVVSAVTAVLAAMYGSTLSSMVTGSLSFVGSIIIAVGLINSNYATVMIGRLIFVLFWSLLTSFQCVIIFRQFQGKELAWVLALQILAIRIGTAAGMFFAGPIIGHCGGSVPNAFVTAVFLSAISLVSTFLFAYLYRGSSAAKLIRPKMIGHKKRSNADNAAEEPNMPLEAKILCAVIFLYYGGLTPFESFGVDYLTNQGGIDRDIAGRLMSMVVMFSFLSPLVAPIFTTVDIQLKCTVVAQSVVALAMFGTIFSNNPIVPLAVIGIGHLFCVNSLWLSLAGVSPTEYTKAEAASMGYAMNSLGTCFNTWTTGKVRDMYGDYTVAYSLLAGSVFLAMCGTSIVWYRKEWKDTEILPSPKLDTGCLFEHDPITEVLLASPKTPLIHDYFSKPISTQY